MVMEWRGYGKWGVGGMRRLVVWKYDCATIACSLGILAMRVVQGRGCAIGCETMTEGEALARSLTNM